MELISCLVNIAKKMPVEEDGRHVQLVADQFWKRWLREYLATIQLRSKWLNTQRNVAAGALVLVVDEATPRKSWPLARVMSTSVGRDGLVRSGKFKCCCQTSH